MRPHLKAADLKAELLHRWPELLVELKGQPSSKSAHEWRFGRKGSFSAKVAGPNVGAWRDHEADIGGGPLELIAAELNLPGWREAADYGRRWLGNDLPSQPRPRRDRAKERAQEETAKRKRIDYALSLWDRSQPIAGTLGETYLREHRGITGTLPSAVRFLPATGKHRPSVILPATDAAGNITAVQLIHLDPVTARKIDKRSHGVVTGAGVVLRQPIAKGVVIVTEGPENGLTALMAGKAAGIIVTLGASNLAAQTITDGRAVLLLGDGDDPTSPATRTLLSAAAKYHAAGRMVHVCNPPLGLDANDLLRRDGIDAVRKLLVDASKSPWQPPEPPTPARAEPVEAAPVVPPHYPAAPVSREIGIEQLQDAIGQWFAKSGRQARAHRDLAARREKAHAAIELDIDDPEAQAKAKSAASRAIRRDLEAKHGRAALGDGDRLQIRVAAGAGKSHETALRLSEIQSDVVTHVYQPTLLMAEQFAALVPGAVVVRGRLAPDMCEAPDLVKAVAAAGLPIQPNVCDDGKGNRCAFFDGCRYQAQRAAHAGATSGVFVMAQEYLAAPAPVARPDLVIVDESHWQKLAADCEFSPSLLTDSQPWKVAGDLAEAMAARATLAGIKAALECGEPILAALRSRGIDKDRLTEAARHLAAIEEAATSPVRPGSDHKFALRALSAYQKSEVWKLRRLVAALIREIDCDRPEANAVQLVTKTVSVDGKPERQSRVVVAYLKPNRVAAEVPALLLDASADLEINRHIWGERLTETKIDIERRAEVIQVTGKVYSRQSITGRKRGKGGADLTAKSAAESERLRCEIAAFVGRLPGRVAVFASKGAEDALGGHMMRPNVVTGHFGALRGRNDWADCDSAVIVGREQPSPQDIETLARAVFAADPTPINATGTYATQDRARRMRDGTGQVEAVQVHPDPRCQAVLEQIREREIEQATDRLRLIHAKTPKTVWLLTSIVCDLTVDRVVRHAELMGGDDTLLDQAVARAHAVPLGMKELARCFPDLWPSPRAVQAWLDRQKKGYQNPNRDIDLENGTLSASSGFHAIQWLMDDNFLIVEYRRPGQRGSSSCALINGAADDPMAALQAVVGPVEQFEIIEDHRPAKPTEAAVAIAPVFRDPVELAERLVFQGSGVADLYKTLAIIRSQHPPGRVLVQS